MQTCTAVKHVVKLHWYIIANTWHKINTSVREHLNISIDLCEFRISIASVFALFYYINKTCLWFDHILIDKTEMLQMLQIFAFQQWFCFSFTAHNWHRNKQHFPNVSAHMNQYIYQHFHAGPVSSLLNAKKIVHNKYLHFKGISYRINRFKIVTIRWEKM